MKIAKPLQNIRGNIAFGAGLIVAASLAYTVENRGSLFTPGFQNSTTIKISPLQYQTAARAALSDADYQAGVIAWQYFQNNTQPQTGLVNAVDGFPSTTMWDQASYLLGLIAAHRLGIVDRAEFDRRMTRVLDALMRLPLFQNHLPNKVYDTISLAKTNYANEASEAGIGWSALDIARMIVPLEILVRGFPAHSVAARDILDAWRLDLLTADSALQGARIDPDTGEVEFIQEGRLGYEEYGARAAAILALDTLKAARHDLNIRFGSVYDVDIASDLRDKRNFGASNYVLSEPYILMALEMGFDRDGAELAYRALKAQEKRYLDTGIPTAVSEDHIDQAPHFLYNSIFVNGQFWTAVSEEGDSFNELKSLSTKAAFGWDMIYGTEYTGLLKAEAQKTRSDGNGWFAGIYERDRRVNRASTANTNGIILEALHFRVFGPLLNAR